MKKVFALAVLALAAGASHAQLAAAQSQAGSASQAGAASQSGATGNLVLIDQSAPAQQSINSTSTGTQTLNYGGGTSQDIHYSGTTTVKNVPMISLSGPSSGPCTGTSGSIGIAGAGFGVGGNFAAQSVKCDLREAVRILGMGMQSLPGDAPQRTEMLGMMMGASRALYEVTMNEAYKEGASKPAEPAKVAAAPTAAPVMATACKGYGGSDPLVLKRLGCK